MSGDGLAVNEIRHWQWQAPPNTTLAGLDLRRAFDLAGGDNRATPSMNVMLNSQFVEQNGTSVVSGNGIERLGDLSDWRAPQNRILLTDAHSISGNGLVVGLGCLGSTGYSCPNTGSDASRVLVHSATFTLSDPSAPSVQSVGGSLLTAVDRKVHSLTISASDLGGGVYRAIVEIDGALFAAPVLDGNGGRCADAVPSTPEPYEFQHRVPCKLQVTDAQVPVDTRSLSEGPHTLRVWVEDAAGNRTSAAAPRTIGVADATGQQPSQHDVQQDTQANATASTAPNTASTSSSGLNGAPGGAGAKLTVWHSASKRTIRVRYGRRLTLTGELLLPTGQPVAGAIVDVLSQTRVRGSALRHVTTVRTDASGRFTYVAPAGPSRLIRFGYRARLGDTAFSHTTDVHLRVVARLSFELNTTRLHNGQILRYGGRLGGPNSTRKFVEIRVKKGSRWQLVGVARTDSRGRFMWRYRFRRTFRPTTYAFRANVRRQENLPYEPSRSTVRRVRVAP
jgi:hypothetical protein